MNKPEDYWILKIVCCYLAFSVARESNINWFDLNFALLYLHISKNRIGHLTNGKKKPLHHLETLL